MLNFFRGEEMPDEVERCMIEPLEIVQKECKRMVGRRKYADKASQDHLETGMRLLGRQFIDRRLWPYQKREIGHEIHEHLADGAYRIQYLRTPAFEFAFVAAQYHLNKPGECLGERGVRYVRFVLIQLSGRKQAARWNQCVA